MTRYTDAAIARLVEAAKTPPLDPPEKNLLTSQSSFGTLDGLQMIEIEKGVPLPAGNKRGRGNKSPLRLALEAMEIGDSFMLPPDSPALNTKDLKPRKFTVRRVDGGARVWRTE